MIGPLHLLIESIEFLLWLFLPHPILSFLPLHLPELVIAQHVSNSLELDDLLPVASQPSRQSPPRLFPVVLAFSQVSLLRWNALYQVQQHLMLLLPFLLTHSHHEAPSIHQLLRTLLRIPCILVPQELKVSLAMLAHSLPPLGKGSLSIHHVTIRSELSKPYPSQHALFRLQICALNLYTLQLRYLRLGLEHLLVFCPNFYRLITSVL